MDIKVKFGVIVHPVILRTTSKEVIENVYRYAKPPSHILSTLSIKA